MALGNRESYGNDPLIFLSARTKDKEGKKVAPHFQVGRKVGEDIVNDEQTVTTFSGALTRVEIKERTFKGKASKEIVLYVKDRNLKGPDDQPSPESYRLGLLFGIAARGLFNRLATLTEVGDFTNLSIDYYENKKGYDQFGLKQNGEQVKWKYDQDQTPKPLEIKHPISGEVLQRDYTALNVFFEKELRAIAAKLGQKETSPAKAAQPAPAASAAPASAPATDAAEAEDDSLPF